ncbi:aspartate/glutamate racemase family protein, partial [Altererythrobacter sp.]|nr:aspartate/glutamate racemase family protein [Altererythrobacter sp.]
DVLEVPIIGTVPAIKPAAKITATGVIGLLGTDATVRQPYVDRLEAEFAASKTLIRHPAPALVDLAERKLRGEVVDPALVDKAVEGLRKADAGAAMDVVVLACTHFPLLQDELTDSFGSGVQFIDGSAGIARRIVAITEGQDFDKSVSDRFVATGKSVDFQALRPILATYGLEECITF